MPAASLNPEQFAALDASRQTDYRQNGDVYELIIDGLDNHSAVAGLRNNNAALKTEKDKAAERARAFEALGLAPDKIKELVDAQAAADQKKLEEEGRYQDIIAQTRDAHAAELTTVKTAAQEREQFLMRSLNKNLITRTATEAIIAAGGNEQTVAMLLPHAERSLAALEEGDGDARDFVVRVIGADGKPRVKNGAAEFMGVKELALELKEKFAPAFPATGTGGGGATGGQKAAGGAKSVTRAQFDAMDPSAQMAHATSGGTVV